MTRNLNQTKLLIKSRLDELRKDYGLCGVGIFGSVARKEKKTNDLDLLVDFTKPIGFFKFLELEERLSKILGQRVDLVTKNALKPAIKEEILQETVYV